VTSWFRHRREQDTVCGCQRFERDDHRPSMCVICGRLIAEPPAPSVRHEWVLVASDDCGRPPVPNVKVYCFCQRDEQGRWPEFKNLDYVCLLGDEEMTRSDLDALITEHVRSLRREPHGT